MAHEDAWSLSIPFHHLSPPDSRPKHPTVDALITTAEELEAFWAGFEGGPGTGESGEHAILLASVESARKQVRPPAPGEVLVYLVGHTPHGRSWALKGFREAEQALVAETNVHTGISGPPRPGATSLRLCRVKTSCTQLRVRQTESADQLEPGEPLPE